MNKYNTSSIYKLVLNDEVYYGSTTEHISTRFKHHKSLFKRFKEGKIKKRCASFALFERDFDNVKCELVESISCETKEELHRKEREYIEANKCINILIPTRTRAEYIRTHPDKINASRAKWRESNREITRTKANTKIDCECGGKYTRANKSVHIKSQRHLTFEESKKTHII